MTVGAQHTRESAREGVMSARVLLIDHYDSFTYNLAQQLWSLGVECVVRPHDELSFEELCGQRYTHFMLSPGPGNPHRPEDFNRGRALGSELWREPFAQPLLGVCLGHQAIAMSLGAEVRRAPVVMHGKESLVRREGGRLFEGLPERVSVMRYHSLCVLEPSLPPELTPVAWSEDDGVLMAFEHAQLDVFGVQFHPESVATPLGGELIKRFVALQPNTQRRWL